MHLIQLWAPTKASQITTHTNLKITLTTASEYVIAQTYDLTVTGAFQAAVTEYGKDKFLRLNRNYN